MNKPEVSWLRYGYVGLVIGYFGYYYLYAGNWDYYVSGAWARQTDQLSTLLDPGFYLFGQAINIPKIVAVPITLGLSTALGDRVGRSIEHWAKSYSRQRDLKLSPDVTGFTREKRHAAYKGVVREALEEGYANYSSSLEVLQQLRQELGITDDEHREVLEELGIEDPELLNPDRKRSLENQIRLTGYRKSLERLHPEIIEQLTPLSGRTSTCAIDYSSQETLNSLSPLLDDRNPLIQTACLYITAQLDLDRSQTIARNYTDPQSSSLVNEAVKIILSASKQCPPLTTFSLLEKVVHLFNSDFFNRIHSETLIALSARAEFRTFTDNEVITEAGDTCRELLLLIEGNAQILFHLPNQQIRIEQLKLGQTLDELEVLAHSDSQNTIVAKGDFTRILAVPVNAFDDLLDRDRDFARRVLELESRQLQRFMRSLQPI